jgi:inner membrane protein
MPSPIAHLAAGYVIYRLTSNYEPPSSLQLLEGVPTLLLLAGGVSLLPDVDSLAGVLLGDFGRYHNNASHSLLVGAGIALVFATFMKWRTDSFGFWFLFAFLCYNLHVLMDAATWSRGVMALWPISAQRFLSPVTLFYGLHWSDGFVSSSHLWTLVTELVFAVVVMLPWGVWPRRGPFGQ